MFLLRNGYVFALCFVSLLFFSVTESIKNHGPAHQENDSHALKSQKMANELWKMQQKHREDVLNVLQNIKKPKEERMQEMMNDHKLVKKLRRDYIDSYHPSAAMSLLQKTSFSKPFIPKESEDIKH
eukprot:c16836_g1_i2.p1 GENE.c16836_g1_i2~~c16836_g1_i2.p1  ORF type:complete len:126 (+),score=30.17 c16836_g1_i2:42-419(+)